MARADSTIRVNIIGDAQELSKAAGKAEKSIGGLGKAAVLGGAAIAGAFAAEQLVEFGQTALKEADRVGDAMGRIEASLGPDLSRAIIDRADDFSQFGASEGDMLELEARIIDIGTAAGVAAADLAPFAEQAAAIASQLALVTDIDAATWIDKIGKAAASGDMRSLRDLGIFLDDAAVNAQALIDTGKEFVEELTPMEIATARQTVVLGLLNDKYGDLFASADDLEGKQAELGAKFETLTGQIGSHIEGPLSDLLEITLTLIEKWELGIEVLGRLGVQFSQVLPPQIKTAADGLAAFLGILNDTIAGMNELIGLVTTGAGAGLTKGAGLFSGGPTSRGGKRASQSTTTVYVQGGSPEVIEQSVRRAVNGIARRSGVQE